jgi:RHS repeat-associated protein
MHKARLSLTTQPRSCVRVLARAPALRTHYLYADEGLIAESTQAITLNADGSVTASSTPHISTQYGPRPDSEFTTGTLFVKTKNSNGQDTASPVVAYLHHDHLQTPLQATDKAGNVVWAASYNAFGKASITTPAAAADKPTITVNLRLPGQYLDEETGLHYNWHRYYDGEVGRYVTEDPIGLRGGVNRYGYALANPLKYTDSSGLDVFLCSQPAFGIPNNPLDHQWLKTDTAEAGMGGTRGNIPGNQSGDMPGDPVQVTDHTGRSKEKGASCAKVDGVDEKKVNDALRIGRPLGRWGPTNQCQSFARQTLIDAGWKQPRPPYVPNPLPPFGF